jgi:hypothetical protein
VAWVVVWAVAAGVALVTDGEGQGAKGGALGGAAVAGIVLLFVLMGDGPFHGDRFMRTATGAIAIGAWLGWWNDRS